MIKNLIEMAESYISAKTCENFCVSINEAQAKSIVKKLIDWYPIYQIFCTEQTGLGNLELILSINPALLENEDFVYGVAAFYCTKEKKNG